MKFNAHIKVMPQKALLDPQGRAVSAGMKNLNLPEIGKVDVACKKLLSNPIMETYEFQLEQA